MAEVFIKNTAFYNTESASYSRSRYPDIPQTYTQSFFRRRLQLSLKALRRALGHDPRGLSLLEVGCADGVVMRAVDAALPGAFSQMVGVDIAEKMIEVARAETPLPHAEFHVRSAYASPERFDVELELGVVNYVMLEDELRYAKEHLKDGGIYILSMAGTDSIFNKIKGGGEKSRDLRTYWECESLIQAQFTIVEAHGYGFFVPYLWRAPVFARLMQPFVEVIANAFFKNLCHEKLYVLKPLAARGA